MMEEDYGLDKAVTKLNGLMSSHIKEQNCKIIIIIIKCKYINHWYLISFSLSCLNNFK